MGYGDEEGQVGEWAKEKLRYLQSYLPSFTKATKKAKSRYYIDGFAGTGKWIVRETGEEIKGSAQIALETNPPFSKCFFIEKDASRADKLKELQARYPSRASEVICGDCNEVMPLILRQISPYAPTFVFLDPSGAHIKWSTIQLLSKYRTELFINFPLQMDLQRRLPNDPAKLNPNDIDTLNAYFGSEAWKDIYSRKFSLEYPRYSALSLMELYVSGLKELGYKYVHYSDAIRNSRRVKLYYLIWVGKHPVGEEIMRHVLRVQFNPQLSLFDNY
ncbi:hypothetical protein E306M_06770 [Moorella sp. E306M]|nr:hypothetical protein E306M_06770 [Moorella sp. E306M]